MKINDLYSTPPDGNIRNSSASSSARVQKGAEGAGESSSVKSVSKEGYGAGGAGRVGGSDQIDISGLANVLQAALEDSPARQAKLDSLAKEFEAGTYNPDPAAVSKKLFEESIQSEETFGKTKRS